MPSIRMPTLEQPVAIDSRNATKNVGGLAKAARGLAVAFGAITAIKFLGKTVKEASEAQQVFVKFTASMKANGQVTAEQTKQLSDYASAQQLRTRFDDEAIRSAESQLSLFKLNGQQIKDTIPLVLDYAARTGQDAPAAATALGRALLGNTRALKTIGVNFKATGDRTKDLTTLTGLLQAKVGGFAQKEGKTYAGRVAEMHNATKELEESIGNLLLPALTFLAGVVVTKVIPPLQLFVNFIGKDLIPRFKESGPIIHSAAVALASFAASFTAIILASKATSAIKGLSTTVAELVGAGWLGVVIALVIALGVAFVYAYKTSRPFKATVDAIAGSVAAFGQAVAKWFMDVALPAMQRFWNAAQPFITGFVTALLSTIGAVSAFAVGVATGFSHVGDVITQWATNVGTFFAPFIAWINDNVLPTIAAIADFFVAIGERIAQIWNNVIFPILTLMGEIFSIVFQSLKDVVDAILPYVFALIQITFSNIVAVIKGIIDIIGPAWSIFWNFVFNVVSTMISNTRIVIETVLGVIRGVFQIFAALIRGDWSGVWEGIRTIVTSIFGGVKDFIRNTIDGIVDFFRGLPGRLLALVGGIGKAATEIGSAIKDGIIKGATAALRGALDLAGALKDAFVRAWNFIVDKLNAAGNALDIDIPFLGTIGLPDNVFNALRLAKGAFVDRPTMAVVGDSPGGEFVIPAAALVDAASRLAHSRLQTPPAAQAAAPSGGGTTIINYTFTGPRIVDADSVRKDVRRAELLRRPL